MNLAKECQYCTQRHIGCHSDCKIDKKIHEEAEKIKKNRAKDVDFYNYVRRDSRNKRSHVY